ncbi:TPA: phage tail protein, partial [Klebsiella pneumoniae subsp. pneumoniae]|nr:phage tail protein [Klebsiella pneumoniae subsp. pneumoniae]
FASSKESAVEQATQAFRKARPSELLTRDERYEKANQEEIRLSDVRWKHLSLDDLYALLNRMNGDKTTLQDASSREFTGNGGRRTSAAVAAQGARDTAIMCGCLERYIVWRRRNTHFSD